MCVIACCQDKFPSDQSIRDMELMNGHGGGIAYIKDNKVIYEKGINANRIIKLIHKKKIQTPAIIHFRIETQGGKTHSLCHPFPIQDNIPLLLRGEADKVLFHNGNWSGWQEICFKAVIAKSIPFITGECSDTRAIAWLVNLYGENILTLIDGFNKFAILTPQGIKKYGNGWSKHENIDVSNTNFDQSWKKTLNNDWNDERNWHWNVNNRRYESDTTKGNTIEVITLADDDEIIKEGSGIGSGIESLDDPDTIIESPDQIMAELSDDILPIGLESAKVRKNYNNFDNMSYYC